MDIKEIQKFFEENRGNEEVNNYIRGFITSDRVEEFLKTEDGKKLLQPKLDSYFSKGLKTWQDNNLQALVDAEYKKQHPEADPANEALRKVQKELEEMKAEKLRTELKNIGIKYATEKKLPVDLVDYFIGADETATKANIDNLAKIFEAHDKTVKEELLKQNSYTPPAGGSGGKDSIAQKLLDMNKGTNGDLETAKQSYFK